MRSPTTARVCVTASCIVFASATQTRAQEQSVRATKAPPSDVSNKYYVGNRAPLKPSPFVKLPIGHVEPRGWLREMLALEANGMTGRLPEVSHWCKFEGNAWASGDGRGHSPWEEVPYWLYNRTGDKWLLDLVDKLHRHTADWTSGVINQHGVNITQGFREPAEYWVKAGDEKFLKSTYHDYDDVFARFGQMPGGLFVAD